jgi:hypothetical protein
VGRYHLISCWHRQNKKKAQNEFVLFLLKLKHLSSPVLVIRTPGFPALGCWNVHQRSPRSEAISLRWKLNHWRPCFRAYRLIHSGSILRSPGYRWQILGSNESSNKSPLIYQSINQSIYHHHLRISVHLLLVLSCWGTLSNTSIKLFVIRKGSRCL